MKTQSSSQLTKLAILAILALPLVSACSKTESRSSTVSPVELPVTAYVGGYTGNDATVWKVDPENNVEAIIVESQYISRVESVFVANDTIYAGGASFENGRYSTVLWQIDSANNVTKTVINEGSSTDDYIHSVFVKGADVYACGAIDNHATAWKNGTQIFRAPQQSDCRSIQVTEDKIYAAGSYNNGNTWTAAYWDIGSNDEFTTIDLVPNDINGSGVNSLIISGNDIYAGGDYYNGSERVAAIWKNGVKTELQDSTRSGNVFSLSLNGSDLFAAGMNFDGAKFRASLWQNNDQTILLPNDLPYDNAFALSVRIHNSDVYVSGIYINTTTNSVLWKNGEMIALSDGAAESKAYTLFLK